GGAAASRRRHRSTSPTGGGEARRASGRPTAPWWSAQRVTLVGARRGAVGPRSGESWYSHAYASTLHDAGGGEVCGTRAIPAVRKTRGHRARRDRHPRGRTAAVGAGQAELLVRRVAHHRSDDRWAGRRVPARRQP